MDLSTVFPFLHCPALRLLHGHSADHAGVAMARDQTRELELARLGELPDHLACLLWSDARRIWIIVLHLWVHFHRFGVLQVFFGRCKHELMIEFAIIVITNLIVSPLRISTLAGT